MWTDTDNWGAMQIYNSGSSIVKVWNNIVYDFNIPDTTGWQPGLFNNTVDATGYFYNNTVINMLTNIVGYLGGK